MYKKFILILGIALMTGGLNAQKSRSLEIFCPGNSFQARGYHFGAGFPWMRSTSSAQSFRTMVNGTTVYEGEIEAKTKAGFYAEFGGFILPKRGLFRMIDIGFQYSHRQFAEQTNASRASGGDLSYPNQINLSKEFLTRKAAFHLGFRSVIPVGGSQYLSIGPGLSIIENMSQRFTEQESVLDMGDYIPARASQRQVNLSFAWGIKLNDGRILEINTRLPLYGFNEASRPKQKVFSSQYIPHLIGLRFIRVKGRPDRACPAMSRNGSGRLGKRKMQSDFYPW